LRNKDNQRKAEKIMEQVRRMGKEYYEKQMAEKSQLEAEGVELAPDLQIDEEINENPDIDVDIK
jgi:hypothetical protein